MPEVTWFPDDDLGCLLPLTRVFDDEATKESVVLDAVSDAGLQQVNYVTNDDNKRLDLAFVNDATSWDVLEPPIPLLNIDRHHPPLLLMYACDEMRSFDSFDADDQFDFGRCDFNRMNVLLSQIDWNVMGACHDPDEATSIFYQRVYEILQAEVPRRRPFGGKRLAWWNRDLSYLKNRQRKARKKFSKSPNPAAERRLVIAESRFKDAHRNSYQNYLNSVQRRFKQEPSSFWNYVRNKKGDKNLTVDLAYKTERSSSGKEAAELCAKFFKSTFVQHGEPPDDQHLRYVRTYDLDIPQPILSLQDIQRALQRVDVKKGPGPDKLSPLFLKSCAQSLALPVSILFNLSLRTGVFPSIWKMAAMVPIHKSGSIHNMENYRGVSILSGLAKLLELFVLNAMKNATSTTISDHQHGFRKNRSTVSNLMVYIPFISQGLGIRKQVDSIYIDFSKAFDRLSHKLIISKLDKLGLPCWLLIWLTSYLENRKAYVKHGRACSKPFPVISGVPQGSHLGPLLFNLFINDVCDCIKSEKVMFADDLKFYRVIRNVGDCHALQEDLNALMNWCQVNGMVINATKSKVMSFYRSRSPIVYQYSANGAHLEQVESLKDLGIIVDSKLSFKEHLQATVTKARTTLGFISRNTQEFTDIQTLKCLYFSLVRSILEYGLQIWAPRQVGDTNLFERVQRTATWFILAKLPANHPARLFHYEERLQFLQMEKLSLRILFLRRLFMFDVVNGVSDCEALVGQLPTNTLSRTLREAVHIRLPNDGWRSFFNPFYECCKCFNTVSDMFSYGMSKQTFKCRIKSLG